MFPKIQSIDDVLPAIEDKKEFVVLRKGGYTAIDYVFQANGTFEDPMHLECRGIKFGPDGRIIARPLHKFFNVGEREQLHEVDFSAPHVVTEKLDGSMIHPAYVGKELRFMTRKGITDVSERAEADFLRDKVAEACRAVWAEEGTPIFEYTSPANRIVLRYDEPRLTLLAVRDMVSGVYWPRSACRIVGRTYGIPLVEEHGAVVDGKSFVADAKALLGREGYVVRFETGHALKIKADEYVTKHKALDGLQSKKSTAAVVLDGLVDDVLPLLSKEDQDDLRQFSAEVLRQAYDMAEDAHDFTKRHGHLSRKGFALGPASTLSSTAKVLAFMALDGRDVLSAAKEMLRRNPQQIIAKWRGE